MAGGAAQGALTPQGTLALVSRVPPPAPPVALSRQLLGLKPGLR